MTPIFNRNKHENIQDNNIIIVSDLHVGLDLRYGESDGSQDPPMQEFAEFLRYHSEHRENGKPWLLIINGDFIEFLGLGYTKFKNSANIEEKGPDKAASILERVMNHQRTMFNEMSDFIMEGNRLIIISGNHDPHFYWEKVQRTFIKKLEAFACRDGGILKKRKAPVRIPAGVKFLPWFYIEDGALYVEHGHQYDENCSMENLLHPTDGEGMRFIRPSMASLGVRYFLQHVPRFPTTDYESITLNQFFRWGFTYGWTGFLKIIYQYVYTSIQIMHMWKRSRHLEKSAAWIRSQHRLRLLKLEEETGLAPGVLIALNDLKSEPSYKSLNKVIRLSLYDRVLLLFLVIVCGALTYNIVHGPWKIAVPFWSISALASGNLALGLFRPVKPGKRMIEIAYSIMDLLNVSLVTFGHTHRSEEKTIEDKGKYFNSGSWTFNKDPLYKRPYLKAVRSTKGLEISLLTWKSNP